MKFLAALAAVFLATPAYAHHDSAADFKLLCQQMPWACNSAGKKYDLPKVGPSTPEEAAEWEAARTMDWMNYGRHGGPVYVRSHMRCNSSKCWSVQAYTRSR